jgi:hypothetical protein
MRLSASAVLSARCASRLRWRFASARRRADHLQRWLDAYRAGRITKADVGEAVGQIVIVTRWQVIPERAA